jgi:RNA polymerase sigma-70 factor (ECF subfamily)
MTDAEFRDAFHRHKNVVFRYAFRMTGSASAAEDVVQDSFLALWRKPEAYVSTRGEMRAFLLGITRNLILKQWRDQRPHLELDDDSWVIQPLDLEESERAEGVGKAVLALPPLQRETLVLAEFEDFSLEEIAQATGAEIAAVKSRLHRARQNLRRMLAPLLEMKGMSK